MSHANARLTFHGRLLIVRRHLQGWKQAHIAAAMGVSRKCVKTWIDRYAAEGEPGLHDRSSRPRICPRHTADELEQKIIALRKRERRGPDWISAQTGVPARTVSRVLARNGIPHLAALDPISGEVIKASKATAHRYERQHPGKLVHMDVKKLGRIPDGGGWRAEGQTRPNHQAAPTGPGSATTTSTPWSMTSPGSPTQRSSRMRRARPAPHSSNARSRTSPPWGSAGSNG